MCCEKDRTLLKTKSESLRCHKKKKSKGMKKTVAGLVPKSASTRIAGKKRVAICNPKENGNDSDIVMDSPDHSKRKKLRQKRARAIIDSPVTCQPPVKKENLGQRNLDTLPLGILVQIICKLKADDLKPLFHVSKKFRKAVLIARQTHFAFTTPTLLQPRSRFHVWNSDTGCWSNRSGLPAARAPRVPRGKSQKTFPLPRVPVRTGSSKRLRLCEAELCEALARQTL